MILNVETWPLSLAEEMPGSSPASLSDVARDQILVGLIECIEEAWPGSVRLLEDPVLEERSPSGSLLVPGTRMHISTDEFTKDFVGSLLQLSTAWVLGAIPGPHAAGAAVTAVAVGTFFKRFSKLTDRELVVVRRLVTLRGQLSDANAVALGLDFDGPSVLNELRGRKIVSEIDGQWYVEY